MKPPERCSTAADSSLIKPTQINLHTWRLLISTKKEEQNIKCCANCCTSRGLLWQDNSYFGEKCPRHVSIKQACDGKVVCSEALHFVIAIFRHWGLTFWSCSSAAPPLRPQALRIPWDRCLDRVSAARSASAPYCTRESSFCI